MCVFYFINYSAWNQPSLSHAKREGSKDPKADDNLEHGRKIFQHDISGILGYKLCTRHINRLHNIFFKYVSIQGLLKILVVLGLLNDYKNKTAFRMSILFQRISYNLHGISFSGT